MYLFWVYLFLLKRKNTIPVQFYITCELSCPSASLNQSFGSFSAIFGNEHSRAFCRQALRSRYSNVNASQGPSKTHLAPQRLIQPPVMFSRRLPRLSLFSGNDLSHSHSPPVCCRYANGCNRNSSEIEMERWSKNIGKRGGYREKSMEGDSCKGIRVNGR